MPRRSKARSNAPPAPTSARPEAVAEPPTSRPFWTPLRLGLVVVLLLGTQWSLAVLSLLRENPTVDEVVHLPAGVSYWQTGTFRLYPHNPPLVKLIAALPVLWARPETADLYRSPMWGWATANKAAFAHGFAFLNAQRYFDLFASARLLMPAFAVLGGLVVFDWSRRLYGPWGGLISLTLWTFCPNVLAHSRLVTTDIGATVIGFAATYSFWRYVTRPTWRRAAVAGLMLGIAQLTKFSLLLLYGLWPIVWLIFEVSRSESGMAGRLKRVGRAIAQGVLIVAISVLVIDLGYGFEGVGKPLGSYPFTSDLLTADREPPVPARLAPGRSAPTLSQSIRQFRVNRFQGTPLAALPVPLPMYYVSGFDDQKLEAEGVPIKAMVPFAQAQAMGSAADEIAGYPVYLNGELRNESWWYYYLIALLLKVPEGTWVLVLLSIVVIVAYPKARAPIADEATLWLAPVVVLAVMSFGTNIALGLRYVLPIFPYVFTSAGKLAPWAIGLKGRRRMAAVGAIALGLSVTVAASAFIHPHYLAYFNWASGGARHGSEHLIDSNLDWGQDLVNLTRWIEENAPDEPVGIAYFGQINPEIFNLRARPAEWWLTPRPPGEGWPDLDPPLDWFLPPALPGTMPERSDGDIGPPRPGLYAVSASLMRGLPWRVYDRERWAPFSAERNAFRYFEDLEPIGHVGYSILLYRIDERDAARLARFWNAGPDGPSAPPESSQTD